MIDEDEVVLNSDQISELLAIDFQWYALASTSTFLFAADINFDIDLLECEKVEMVSIECNNAIPILESSCPLRDSICESKDECINVIYDEYEDSCIDQILDYSLPCVEDLESSYDGEGDGKSDFTSLSVQLSSEPLSLSDSFSKVHSTDECFL